MCMRETGRNRSTMDRSIAIKLFLHIISYDTVGVAWQNIAGVSKCGKLVGRERWTG